jgi:hypothetical protein
VHRWCCSSSPSRPSSRAATTPQALDDSVDGTPTIVVGRTGADGIDTHAVPDAVLAPLASMGLVAPAT